MISWWPGDGNAVDIQGSNNGTLESATTFAPGEVGQAFSFNGVDGGGGVNLGDVPAFDFTPASSFTMEAWVKTFGPSAPPQDAQAIVVLNNQCSNTVQALSIPNSTGKVVFQVRDANGLGGFVVSPSSLSLNAFHHVAGVREVTNASTTVKLYIDGVLVATAPDLSTGPLATNTSDFIGRRFPCANTNTFNGLIDEPAIYNRALSDAEIQAIYNAGSAGKCKPVCTPPPPNMVSWWPGDGSASDIQGGNNGTLLGGATFAAGKVGQAFDFNGVNGEVSIAHTSALNFGHNDSFSVDAWLKPDPSVLGTGRAAVSLTYVCSPEVIALGLNTDGTINFEIRDSNNIAVDVNSPSSIVDGQWHHLTGVRDTISHTVTLYLDGASVASLPDTTTGTFTRADAQDRIGSIAVACPTNRYFWKGQIDEVEVFNRALSPSEVQAICNASSAGKCKTCTAPLDWWPAEGNANDIKGNNNGTLQNGAMFAPGRVGQAFSFDGIDDFVSVPDNPSLTLGAAPFTIDLWVNFNQLTGRDPFIGHDDGGGNQNKWIFWYDTIGHGISGPALRFHINGPSIGAVDPIIAPWNPNTGQWYNVAVTRDGSTYTLYIDGAPVASATNAIAIADPSTPLTIGKAEAFFLHGLIDEVQIFHRALSAAEIEAIANGRRAILRLRQHLLRQLQRRRQLPLRRQAHQRRQRLQQPPPRRLPQQQQHLLQLRQLLLQRRQQRHLRPGQLQCHSAAVAMNSLRSPIRSPAATTLGL